MRILFTSNPLVGHLLPMLPLARAARDAGHDVVVASGPDVAPIVRQHGFRGWSIGSDLATIEAGVRDRPRAAEESPAEELVGQGMAMFARPAVGRGRELRRLTEDWPPDLVVQEIYEIGGSYAGPGSALHVLHGLGAHYPGFLELAGLARSQVAAELGPPVWDVELSSALYVDPFPAVLQPPGEQPWSQVLPIRPEAGEVAAEDAPPPSSARATYPRTVYLTFGTVFNDPALFRPALAALAPLPLNVVLTCGPGLDPAALGPLPDHVAVSSFVPQALLLPRCDAVVSHAGAGTVLGALVHGLPQVCLPQGADQPVNAAQVARLGAGLALGPGAGAESIRAAVLRVLDDPSFAAAARVLQREIAAIPGPAEVLASLLERVSASSGTGAGVSDPGGPRRAG